MTDTLGLFSPPTGLDDDMNPIAELGDTGETSPADGKDLSSIGSIVPSISVACPECRESFTGMTSRGVNRVKNAHMRERHPDSPDTPKLGEGTPKKTRSKKVVPTGRQSGADLISMLADGIGSLVATTGVPSSAAGLALKLEAPLVGPAGDKAIAGTKIDKMALQPLIGAKGRFDEIGPLIMFPIVVGLIDKGILPAMQAKPIMKAIVGPILPQLVRALGKQKADQEKMERAAQELADMDPLFAAIFAQGGDPVDAILNVLFPAPLPETPLGDE